MTQAPPGGLLIEPGDPFAPDVAVLLRHSEEYARSLYPPESVHMIPVEELVSPSVRFLVARDQDTGRLLGCGAVVLHADGWAELKRMFVDPAARRRGVGTAILDALERLARAEGVAVIRLETGTRQGEAIALYRRFGYQVRGPFADYWDDPLSVFMERRLDEHR